MKLAVCDQQWLFASVLAAALSRQGHEVVTTTDLPRILLDEAPRREPDVCVLDVVTGPPSVVEVAERLHELVPGMAVILLTDSCQEQVWEAYDRGLFGGVVNKACAFPTFLGAVERVAAGERITEGWPTRERRAGPSTVLDALTTREVEVLHLVVQGYSTQTMADRLGVSRHTVRTHVQQVLRKLGVHGRGKIARAAAAAGLVDVTAPATARAYPRP
jgi:DNA-binding NarL/FixJ family response regulator